MELQHVKTVDEAKEILCNLARQNKLQITDIFSLPLPVRDLYGMVCLNQTFVNADSELSPSAKNPAPDPEPLPDVLANYKIKIECINSALDENDQFHNKIRWSRGLRFKESRTSKRNAHIGTEGVQSVKMLGPDIQVREGPICELPLKDAWLVLKSNGQDCARAKGASKKTVWRYREVPREETEDALSGRRRKA